ncbi:hypothetical protein N9315_02725 [Alphaproteobacteria bacterium]|nr:hypothetical protein [Alphaproteobacteria bacterium]
MYRFKQFTEINEGKYPMWVKLTVGGLVLQMRNLTNRINTETDPKKQNDLISQQNSILSYIGGLGIGVTSKDPQLLNRMKKGLIGKK